MTNQLKAKLVGYTIHKAMEIEWDIAITINRAIDKPGSRIKFCTGCYYTYNASTKTAWSITHNDYTDMWDITNENKNTTDDSYHTLKRAMEACLYVEPTMSPQQMIDNRLTAIEAEQHALHADSCTLDDEQIKKQSMFLSIERGDILRQQNNKSTGKEFEPSTMIAGLPSRVETEAIQNTDKGLYLQIVPSESHLVDSPVELSEPETPHTTAYAYTPDYPTTAQHTKRYASVSNYNRIAERIASYNVFSVWLDLVSKAQALRGTVGYTDVMDSIADIGKPRYRTLTEWEGELLKDIDTLAQMAVQEAYTSKQKISVTIDRVTKVFTLTKSGKYPKPMIAFITKVLGRELSQSAIHADERIAITGHTAKAKSKPCKAVKVTKVTTAKVSIFNGKVQPFVKTW